ncbi:Cytochrome b-c1 complex subunit 7 [Penicillium taxi]|uniref:Cytochrome b-c1 complex subunit 7 n=1 Tax=Penicillium taxi TaxID=168475 RepID=UPI00254599EF|nr:Cytochrome b-c1 complex subunit 7 [Penicillium taxi]KAJ5907870.1 Cytochrome b-c1 complex subunit 7 [Penicillium taxi]
MSAPSVANYIVKRPWLKRWMTPLAHWYTDAAGYRKLGLKTPSLVTTAIEDHEAFATCTALANFSSSLIANMSHMLPSVFRMPHLSSSSTTASNPLPRFDDLIPEESETVQKAIKRLPSKEAYDRVFRIRRAFQCSISHTLLPPAEQIQPHEDVEYLSPIIREIEKENKEREDLDNLTVRK